MNAAYFSDKSKVKVRYNLETLENYIPIEASTVSSKQLTELYKITARYMWVLWMVLKLLVRYDNVLLPAD